LQKIKKIITAILICNALLVLCELLLRVFGCFPYDSKLFVNDANVGFRMRPAVTVGDSKTNSYGFNDIEHTTEKDKEHMRIAFIGDSFVFGVVPRQYNFTSVFRNIAKHHGKSIDVFNMGFPAAGPMNYHGLLREDARRIGANLVYVVLFIGNDILQAHPDFRTVVWLGNTREVLSKPYLIGPSLEYSYVYRVGRASIRMIKEKLFPPETGATFSKYAYLSIEYQRSIVYKKEQSRFIDKSYAEAIQILKKMAIEASEYGMDFCVVLAPDEIQVNGVLRADVMAKYRMHKENYDFDQTQRIISQALKAKGIPVLDLLPVFRAETSGEPLYMLQDTHWNEAGNRIAAEAIWSFFKNTFDFGKRPL
jgi:acetyltransferase AlgX (SGNH hydrolase-like protein)